MRRFARLICLSLFAFFLLSFLLSRHSAQKSFTSMTETSWSSNTHASAEQDKSYSTDSHAVDSSLSSSPGSSGSSNASPHGGYDAPTHQLPSEHEIVLEHDEDRYPTDHSTSPSTHHNDQVTNAHSPDRDFDLTEDLRRPFPGRPNPDNEFGSEEEKNIAAGLGLLPHPQTAVTQTATYQISPTTAANDSVESTAPTPAPAPIDEDGYYHHGPIDDEDFYFRHELYGDRVQNPHAAADAEITASASLAQAVAETLNRYTRSASRTTALEGATATAASDASATTDSYRSEEEGKTQEEMFVEFVHNLQSLESEASARSTADAASASAAAAAAAAEVTDDPRADLLN